MKHLNQHNTIGEEHFPEIEKHRKRILLNALIFPGMLFTFTLCPGCANEYYPDYIKANKSIHESSDLI